jgi:hypothetical protein
MHRELFEVRIFVNTGCMYESLAGMILRTSCSVFYLPRIFKFLPKYQTENASSKYNDSGYNEYLRPTF